MESKAWVVLLRQNASGDVEILSPIDVPERHLGLMAQEATRQGFDLMWEFSEFPDQDEIKSLAPLGEVSGMRTMKRLWVLKGG